MSDAFDMPSVDEEIERLPLTKAFLAKHTLAFDAKMFDSANRMRPSLHVYVVEQMDDPVAQIATRRKFLLIHFATVADESGMRMEFYDAEGKTLFSIDETSPALQDADAFPVVNLGWGMEADSVFAFRAYLMINQTMQLMLTAGSVAVQTNQNPQDVFEHLAANAMQGNRHVVGIELPEQPDDPASPAADEPQPTGGST